MKKLLLASAVVGLAATMASTDAHAWSFGSLNGAGVREYMEGYFEGRRGENPRDGDGDRISGWGRGTVERARELTRGKKADNDDDDDDNVTEAGERGYGGGTRGGKGGGGN